MTEAPAVLLNDLVQRLRAAGEPTRARLLKLLAEGALTVSELTQILGQSQPRVSRHLKLLLDAGLIERLPEGAWVFYRLAEARAPTTAGGFAHTLVDWMSATDSDRVLAGDLERLAAVKKARAAAAATYFAANAAEWNRVRALYLPEEDIETAMLELLGPGPIDLLIDLGTGSGRILEVLGPLYRRGIGFDVSHAMLSVARVSLERAGIGHAHVRYGDLFCLPEPLDRADAVVLHQVLHYLDNPELAIAAAARLLAPGGRLVVVDFAPHQLEFLREEHAHRRLGFSEHDVARWCRTGGLEMSAVRHLPPVAKGSGAAETLTVSLWMAHRQAWVRGSQNRELSL